MDGERYIDEFGEPLAQYSPKEPDKRGRHSTFGSAVEAASKALLSPPDVFFDTLVDKWKVLFPDAKVRPGRREGGMVFLYAPNSAELFNARGRLAAMKKALSALPGAPARLVLKLEVKR